jgi:signal transduction histidine kinase
VPLPEEFGGGVLWLPTEPLPDSLIEYVEVGDSFEELEGDPQVYPGAASLDRGTWVVRLSSSLPLLLIGIGLGSVLGYALTRGWLGAAWRKEAVPFGVAVAVPFMATPLLYTGTQVGALAAFGLAAAGSLPAAKSLADRHPVERWPAAIFAASVAIAATVGLTVLRAQDAAELGGTPFDRLLLVAAVTLVPALVAAYAVERDGSKRAEMVILGLGPGAAGMVLGSTFASPWPFYAWGVLALGWRRMLPIATGLRGWARRSAARDAALVQPALEPTPVPGWSVAGIALRDIVAVGIAGLAAAGALVTCCDTWALILGSAVAAVVGLALRRGFLGPHWKEAAIPLASAVATPIFAVGLASGGGSAALGFGLSTLAALPVAFLLAGRHPDPAWRRILAWVATGIAALAIVVNVEVLAGGDPWYVSAGAERYLLMGLVALVPGLVVAFTQAPVAGTRPTDRLDNLAISLTPGAAMTVLVPSFGPVLFVAWVIGIVAWRRLTIAPLLGLAVRSQRQRDLAVAAVEAERARLAADLHDDALQELSALVRRLDAAGDAEGADLARGVAERLRTITSDLRLPLLDDLGAGPALEWLVGRVRPLADGAVVLERADGERPPAGVELAVFRIAQEALANAVKHGRAPITVRYRVAEDGGVSLSIDDSGPGIEPGAAEDALQAGHLGVANMQQRAQQIGALLDIRRWPAGGTHVALEWRPR